jgi:hypothetical protein
MSTIYVGRLCLMKAPANTAMNKGTKKPYTKPELQVYGNLAEITNASTNRNGVRTDNPGAHPARTH